MSPAVCPIPSRGYTSPISAASPGGTNIWTPLEYENIRGLGDTDFRDGDNNRLWYVASRNLLPREQEHSSSTAVYRPRALNPHALLRLTSGWLIAENDAGAVLSERVAAAVISPGASDPSTRGNTSYFRVAESQFYPGRVTIYVTTTPTRPSVNVFYHIPAVSISATTFVRAYLEDDTYTMMPTVVVPTPPHEPLDDRFRFLTIDELAAEGSEGIELLEEAPVNIYSQMAGEDGLLGVTELLQAHLNKFGHLPDPAQLHTDNATYRSRRERSAALRSPPYV